MNDYRILIFSNPAKPTLPGCGNEYSVVQIDKISSLVLAFQVSLRLNSV